MPDSGIPIREGLHVRAHRLRGTPGGVAVLAINASRAELSTVTLPVVFWVVGGIDPDRYAAAEKAGKLDVLPANHPPDFAPVIHPVLRAGVEAMLAAAGAWLASGTEG